MDNLFSRSINLIMYALLLAGALNWGLVGLFEFNPIAAVFGKMSIVSRFLYSIIGLVALYEVLTLPGIFRQWEMQLHHEPIHA
jgi:uncharacterized membrane protein YuzA (DUF378 family)